MKPEGCFSSRHAAALWSEQSTTRRLFGKEQSTTQSTPQIALMMGRKMHRSVIFRSQCLSSKLAHLQEVRKQYHCFQMPVRSFDDPFMWCTGLAHENSMPLESIDKNHTRKASANPKQAALPEAQTEQLRAPSVSKYKNTTALTAKYYRSQPIRSTARAQSCLGVAKQSSVLKPVQLLNRQV